MLVMRVPRTARIHDAGLALALSMASLFYWFYLRDLFPLTEWRDWVTWQDRIDWNEILRKLFVPEGFPSRHVSLTYSMYLGGMCRDDVRCLNALGLFPLFLTVPLLYVLARQLGLASRFAIAACLLWLFSVPVVNAAAWQATIHDKLALLLALSALSWTLYALTRPLKLRWVLYTNGLLLVLVALAYNCKESAWFLAPGLCATVILCGRGDWRKRLKDSLLLVLPLAYAFYHNVAYLRALGRADPDVYWRAHVWSSPVFEHIGQLLDHSLGIGRHVGVFLGSFAVVVAFVGTCWWRAEEHSWARRYGSALLSATLFVGALTLVSGTRFPAPYYMYTPHAFASILVLQLLQLAQDTLWAPERATTIGLVALACVLWGGMRHFVVEGLLPTNELIIRSDNFRRSLPSILAHVSLPLRENPVVVLDHTNVHGERFVRGTANGLWRHISPRPSGLAMESQMILLRDDAPLAFAPLTEHVHRLRFDSSMTLLTIERGSEFLYQRYSNPGRAQ